jgi:hypothetical protein
MLANVNPCFVRLKTKKNKKTVNHFVAQKKYTEFASPVFGESLLFIGVHKHIA